MDSDKIDNLPLFNVSNNEISMDKTKKDYITESKKQRSFIGEALKDKPVDCIPGVGNVTKENLNNLKNITIDTNIIYSFQLIGLFLLLNDPKKFKNFLLNMKVTARYADVITNNIAEWCSQFIQ